MYDIHMVFDCLDPHRVATFWLAALEGYDFPGSRDDGMPGSPPEGFDTWETWADSIGIPEDQRNNARTIVDIEGSRPDIHFLRVPEGKVVKNRVHLDIKASAGLPASEVEARQDSEAKRLVDLGATIAERVEGHLILRDPEGNEFCVI